MLCYFCVSFLILPVGCWGKNCWSQLVTAGPVVTSWLNDRRSLEREEDGFDLCGGRSGIRAGPLPGPVEMIQWGWHQADGMFLLSISWGGVLVNCPFNMQPRTRQHSSITLLFRTASLVKNSFTHLHQANPPDEGINPAWSWAADWTDDCLISAWLIAHSQLDDDWLDQMLNEAERKITSFVPKPADVLQLWRSVKVGPAEQPLIQ